MLVRQTCHTQSISSVCNWFAIVYLLILPPQQHRILINFALCMHTHKKKKFWSFSIQNDLKKTKNLTGQPHMYLGVPDPGVLLLEGDRRRVVSVSFQILAHRVSRWNSSVFSYLDSVAANEYSSLILTPHGVLKPPVSVVLFWQIHIKMMHWSTILKDTCKRIPWLVVCNITAQPLMLIYSPLLKVRHDCQLNRCHLIKNDSAELPSTVNVPSLIS